MQSPQQQTLDLKVLVGSMCLMLRIQSPFQSTLEYYYVNVNKRITPPRIDTKDALYDVAWSEQSPNIMVAGSADGSVLIIDSFKVPSFPFPGH